MKFSAGNERKKIILADKASKMQKGQQAPLCWGDRLRCNGRNKIAEVKIEKLFKSYIDSSYF